MPLCIHSLRFAVRSGAATSVVRCPQSLRWPASSSLSRRSYTTALAERQQGDKPTATARDTPYLDFLLDGYGATSQQVATGRTQPSARKRRISSVAEKAGARSTGKTAARPTRSGRAWLTQPRLSYDDRARIAARVAAARGNIGLRPAVQSLRTPSRTSAVFSSVWNTKFFQIARRYDKALPEYYLKDTQALTFSPQVSGWVDSLLVQMRLQNGPLDIEAFARQRGMIGREVWSEVALWLLCYQKQTLLDFLEATHTPLYPPINWVEGCLSCLARHYTLTEQHNAYSWSQSLVQLFLKLVNRDTEEQYHFHSSFFRLVLPYCTDTQMNDIYGMMKAKSVRVSNNTLLHIADHFAKHGHLEQSLDALLEAKDAGADVHSVGYKSICSTLLRMSTQHPGGLRLCLRLIENLVSVGLKLNRTLCNIVMLNAVEFKDLDTVDAVHRSAIEQGIVPDAYTCAIRLKACKVDIGNAERLSQVIEEAIASGAVRQNQIVAGEIIHCLALHRIHATFNEVPKEKWWMPKAQTATFLPVATAYMQLFDPAPLERIGIEMPDNSMLGPQELAEQRMRPSRHVIASMVLVYLRTCSNNQLEHIYTRWRELVEAGDGPLAACAATPHLSNIFLKQFTRSRQTLLHAARVVQDMQKPLPASAGVEQAKPDVYTWSIFQHGFAMSRQTHLAEQVMRYMRSKGIEPNVVTWTSLVGGYAVAQDSEGMLDAMRRMAESGTPWNEWTQRGLRHFKNKRKLQEILAKQRLEQNLDFSSELKDGLVQKLSGSGETT
ncbi:hypothetical protein LTR08_003426 [Meristemomyces frigidus]|nr:hypothetical protein LTR08_003426 [Meristemomyces frigidus]